MAYTEKQKLMWEETNNTLNALFAMGLDLRTLLRLLDVTPANASKDVKEVIERIGKASSRISECQKKLQRMIADGGD